MLNKNRGNTYKEFDNTQNPKLRERFIWQTPGCFRNPEKCKRLSQLQTLVALYFTANMHWKTFPGCCEIFPIGQEVKI